MVVSYIPEAHPSTSCPGSLDDPYGSYNYVPHATEAKDTKHSVKQSPP